MQLDSGCRGNELPVALIDQLTRLPLERRVLLGKEFTTLGPGLLRTLSLELQPLAAKMP